MKDFSWSYFCKTGQIDAYLLFKECETQRNTLDDYSELEEEQGERLL